MQGEWSALGPPVYERHGSVGVGQEETTRMLRVLEDHSHEDRLREFRRRLLRDFPEAFQNLKGPTEKMRNHSVSGIMVTEQGQYF